MQLDHEHLSLPYMDTLLLTRNGASVMAPFMKTHADRWMM